MRSKATSKVSKRRKGRRGFGSIYRVGETWYVRIRRNGEQVNEAVGPDKNLAEARLGAICRATQLEHALGVREVGRVTWEDFTKTLDAWLRANHAASTYAAEKGRVGVIGKFLGTKVLADVTRGDIETFLATLRTTKRGRCKQGLSRAAANRYRALLSVAFTRAVESGFARSNPCDGVAAFREDLRAVPFLSGDVIDGILARVVLPLRPFATLAVDTGCRRGELLDLLWADVDLESQTLTVRRSKNGESRVIPLTPRALAVLKALHKARPATPIVGPARVFPGVDPETNASKVSKAWKDAVKAAGMPGLRLHDARHAFASGLARAGVAPGVIGTLLGDKTPSVVFRYSRHAPKNASAEAVGLLAEARGQKPPAPASATAQAQKSTPEGDAAVAAQG